MTPQPSFPQVYFNPMMQRAPLILYDVIIHGVPFTHHEATSVSSSFFKDEPKFKIDQYSSFNLKLLMLTSICLRRV